MHARMRLAGVRVSSVGLSLETRSKHIMRVRVSSPAPESPVDVLMLL